MLRGIINSTSTLFTQIWFYNLIQAQILLAAHEDSISSDGGAGQNTSISLLACLHSTTDESDS